jgi:hypothetical protein
MPNPIPRYSASGEKQAPREANAAVSLKYRDFLDSLGVLEVD